MAARGLLRMSLERSTLERALAERWPGQYSLELFTTLPSTNRHLAAAITAGQASTDALSQCRVCVTARQTAGVGRQGRAWHSPDNSITFSVQRSFDLPAARVMGLSLVCGLAVAQVLAALIREPIELKWPNDLLVCGRKLAGILIELPVSQPGSCVSISGIGINFADGPEHQQIDQPYITLASLLNGSLPDKSSLVGSLAGQVLASYERFDRHGWEAFAEQWQQRDYLAGKPVRLSSGRDTIQGHARGVAADGGLIVETGGREMICYSGEVSVRVVN